MYKKIITDDFLHYYTRVNDYIVKFAINIDSHFLFKMRKAKYHYNNTYIMISRLSRNYLSSLLIHNFNLLSLVCNGLFDVRHGFIFFRILDTKFPAMNDIHLKILFFMLIMKKVSSFGYLEKLHLPQI